MRISGKKIQYNSHEFKVIFERHFPSLYLLASKILQNEQKGKDVAQEAFIKLWEKDVEDFTDENSLKAYLYVLVKNACISIIRKEKKITNLELENGLSVNNEAFLNEVLKEETYILLHKAIKELSPQAEQAVNLTLKGYSNQDIADELNVTINTVKTVKRRAYKLLRKNLGHQFIAW
ncbi:MULTISPECIES: RNA polymerase sigma factor [Mangrovimonas]|uniref:RNA polymerase sigma factor n=1 Tax=Mangrovimonas TaxID=1211036 RepID=UPI0006B48CAF|nr:MULTISPECIES: RNA polymerase sigma factor [Mangrovimonas]OMP30164.1 hypothetical protein BKM32_12310 [Mangrovimonas sp. DI 80]